MIGERDPESVEGEGKGREEEGRGKEWGRGGMEKILKEERRGEGQCQEVLRRVGL